MSSKFDFYLNRQGVRGPQGIQGEQGFSPIITVATNTLSEYVLQIQTQNNTFLTANLREHKDDLGGTYIRYNRETGVMYAGDADVASTSQMGVVRFATATDIEREDDSSVVSPADIADILDDAGYSGDISDLKSDVHDLQLQVATNTQNISDNASAISSLQGSVSGLLANYVPKTRTINGYALSSNITLTASDVNAYSKSEADALLANKADVSDLPDMNNYYNTTQIDLMLHDKADISDIPVVPTNVSAFTNDAGYITSSALPTVGNGTITFTQGGVSKGTITTNQSGDATIALDASSQYTLPPATTSTLGGVIVDGTTITVDSSGVITSVGGGGGGGTTYNPGDGININSSTNTISAKPDGTTIDFNSSGELKVISAPTPSNMVTTDTTQTITGTKTFSQSLTIGDRLNMTGSYVVMANSFGNRFVAVDGTNSKVEVGESTFNLTLRGSDVNIIKNNQTYTNIDSGNIGSYAITSNPVMTGADSSTAGASGLVPQPVAGDDVKFLCGDGTFKSVPTGTVDQTYNSSSTNAQSGVAIAGAGFLTSIPTASTSTLGGVKIDGTSITIDGNGVISSSGGGGGSLPSQTGHDGDVLTTDGTDASWADTADIMEISSELSKLALPSSVHTDLTLGASGTLYTAPADGYYVIAKRGSGTGQYLVAYSDDGLSNVINTSTTSNAECCIVYPVTKGQQFYINYTLGGSTTAFTFYYAVGSESEAS